MRSASRRFAFAAWIGIAAAPIEAQQRWIADGPDRGLPSTEARWLPYGERADDPANRIFALAWLVDLVPAEVAAALPREREANREPKEPGWLYFGKRAGQPHDRRQFGGDGLQLPRESFSDDESKALLAALDALRGEEIQQLHATPALAVWLQSDLLRLARRLLDTNANHELLQPLLDAARRLALPRATLRDKALATFALADLAAADPELRADRLVEIERRSTRLFDAERSLLWSRVWLCWPANSESDVPATLTAIAADQSPAVPAGARSVLAQGLVALADDGTPCATEIAIDVRLQRFVGASDETSLAATTTRDGVDFRVFWLEREALRKQGSKLSLSHFRALHNEDQVLFRDYGTLKHTTVAAQCTLCHRTSGTPEPELAGFPVLRKGAAAVVASSPTARMELAEQQFAKFLATLDSARK